MISSQTFCLHKRTK